MILESENIAQVQNARYLQWHVMTSTSRPNETSVPVGYCGMADL